MAKLPVPVIFGTKRRDWKYQNETIRNQRGRCMKPEDFEWIIVGNEEYYLSVDIPLIYIYIYIYVEANMKAN